jgi:hypothetical protein
MAGGRYPGNDWMPTPADLPWNYEDYNILIGQ